MGLAPYGKPRFKKEFDKLFKVQGDGSFSMDMDYFAFHYAERMNSKKIEELFGQATRKKDEPITQTYGCAASLPKTEETIFLCW